MKKLFSALLALCMVLAALPLTGLTAFAAETTSGDFAYAVLSEAEKTCEITDYTGSATELVIPSELDGYTVTGIGDRSFYRCISLESVTIPNSVTSIGEETFQDCELLASVTIPDSVMSIGEEAFYSCDSLVKVIIGNGVKCIHDYAFAYCALTEIFIPSRVESIGGGVFFGCNTLTNIAVASENLNYSSADGILFNKGQTKLLQYPAGKPNISYTIPSHTTEIGYYAFGSNAILKNVTIPNSVINIGNFAFNYCTALESVIIGNSVTDIGYCAFADCDSLTNIMIPNSVTSIGQYAFAACISLTSITIPNSVTSIGERAFENCHSLESITLPDSVTSIEDGTFWDCIALSSITIPNSVTSIGRSVFSGCESLTSATIPSSVTSIGDTAFTACISLTSVTIPNSVTSIGDSAFDYCDNLTICGYTGSYAESYATENGIPFVALRSVTDLESGIVVSECAVDILPKNTQLVVEQLSTTENSITYDVTLTQNDIEIQPAGTVTVKIPVPETMGGDACKVYRREADGTYTDMNAVFRDGYMVFTTDHFSVYVLTAEDPNTTVLGDVNDDGTVDAVDARWVLQAAAGMRALENAAAADVNGDSTIDAVDARWILQAAADMRTL